MERTPSLEQRLLGQTLAGKYKLLAVQASGAFGTVFRAEQFFCRQYVRPVAVKISDRYTIVPIDVDAAGAIKHGSPVVHAVSQLIFVGIYLPHGLRSDVDEDGLARAA